MISAELKCRGTFVEASESHIPRFHLAVPVDDLAAARRFYGEVLGLKQGRSADQWVDWNLQGHQLVTHLAPKTSQPTGVCARLVQVDLLDGDYLTSFGLDRSCEELEAIPGFAQELEVPFELSGMVCGLYARADRKLAMPHAASSG